MPLGLYEKETAGWLESELKPGMTFMDVGANAGYFTLLGSKCVRAGSVVAFEPIPINVDIIKKHIIANGIANVIVINMALSDCSGHADFTIESNNANSHLSDVSISHQISSPYKSIKVPVSTLDEYVAINQVRPDVIKIDVEGAEMRVLNGGRKTLTSLRPILVVSTHSKSLYEECRNFFSSVQYDIKGLHGFQHELLCVPRK
jgi:FkbM family methyltransferase